MKYLLRSIFCLFIALTSTASFAKFITVTKFNDTHDGVCDSDCSLREAITDANQSPGFDYIAVPAGTYSLDLPVNTFDGDNAILDEDLNANGDLDITDGASIYAIHGQAILDAGGNDRVVEVNSGEFVQLINFTLINGLHPDYGGAIENHSFLTLRYCTITNNLATSSYRPGAGGAIANFGKLNVYQSIITNNGSAAGEGWAGRGGAIYNEGELAIRDTTISDNYVSDITETGSGGGLFNTGTVDIRRSLFLHNTTSPAGNGGAIFTADGGAVKLVSSTIAENVSGASRRTTSGAVASGSDTFSPGKLYLTQVTIADNVNYGVVSHGDTYIKNSIISGNLRDLGNRAQNCVHTTGYYYAAGLLMGRGDNSGCTSDWDINNNQTFKALLNPLALNNGLTKSFAIKPGSLAVDKGIAPCPRYDQRGAEAPKDGDGNGEARCDLGAYELQP